MAQSKSQPKKSNFVKWAAIAAAVVTVLIISIVLINNGSGKTLTSAGGGEKTALSNSDLVIPVSEISKTAKFYPVTIDGTKMEIVAVKAPDGTIRTAFNTCEICYGSGRGYYKQSDDKLVCQNCGNAFKMSEVGLVGRGGCNPYSIFDDGKMVDDTNITISQEFLRESKEIFANWRR